MSEQGYEQLTLYQGDSPVNRSPSPGSAEARMMTVTSGRKCSELSRSSGPLGLLEKTLLESSIWRSTRCYLTWRPKATPQGRLLFRLAVSMPRIGGTGSQFVARNNDREPDGREPPPAILGEAERQNAEPCGVCHDVADAKSAGIGGLSIQPGRSHQTDADTFRSRKIMADADRNRSTAGTANSQKRNEWNPTKFIDSCKGEEQCGKEQSAIWRIASYIPPVSTPMRCAG